MMDRQTTFQLYIVARCDDQRVNNLCLLHCIVAEQYIVHTTLNGMLNGSVGW